MKKYKLAKSVMDGIRISPKILSVDLEKWLTVIFDSATQSGRSKENKNMEGKNGESEIKMERDSWSLRTILISWLLTCSSKKIQTR